MSPRSRLATASCNSSRTCATTGRAFSPITTSSSRKPSASFKKRIVGGIVQRHRFECSTFNCWTSTLITQWACLNPTTPVDTLRSRSISATRRQAASVAAPPRARRVPSSGGCAPARARQMHPEHEMCRPHFAERMVELRGDVIGTADQQREHDLRIAQLRRFRQAEAAPRRGSHSPRPAIAYTT